MQWKDPEWSSRPMERQEEGPGCEAGLGSINHPSLCRETKASGSPASVARSTTGPGLCTPVSPAFSLCASVPVAKHWAAAGDWTEKGEGFAGQCHGKGTAFSHQPFWLDAASESHQSTAGWK